MDTRPTPLSSTFNAVPLLPVNVTPAELVADVVVRTGSKVTALLEKPVVEVSVTSLYSLPDTVRKVQAADPAAHGLEQSDDEDDLVSVYDHAAGAPGVKAMVTVQFSLMDCERANCMSWDSVSAALLSRLRAIDDW